MGILGIGGDNAYGQSETVNKGGGQGGNIGGLVGGAASTILGMAMGRQNAKDADRRQINQQRELNRLGAETSKDLTDYNYAKQLQMWKDTSYGAQKEQMELAGLNPALMYGMGGGGGQSVGSGSGASAGGSQAANSAQTSQAATGAQGMGLQIASQIALMGAQKENIEADTEKKKVEAAKTAGVDTANVEANTGLLNTTNNLKKIEEYVSRHTQQEAIERIIGESRQAIENATTATADAEVARKTVDERIEMLKVAIHKTMNEGDNAVRQGSILEAEAIIKNFEAELTKQGIAPSSPWYVKIVGDMLKGLGLGITKGVEKVKQITQ